jgi:hypothetical protein
MVAAESTTADARAVRDRNFNMAISLKTRAGGGDPERGEYPVSAIWRILFDTCLLQDPLERFMSCEKKWLLLDRHGGRAVSLLP